MRNHRKHVPHFMLKVFSLKEMLPSLSLLRLNSSVAKGQHYNLKN